MITPLASIIGSGFLVLGPILQVRYGWLAPAVMAVLCLTAWAFGSAIRFNIARIETETTPPRRIRGLETLSSVALGLAYVISVAYYLNLFGAFAVSLTPWDNGATAKIVTTAVFIIIGAAGLSGGFKRLEKMEYASVSLKLAIIAGLLFGLAVYFVSETSKGTLYILPPDLGPVEALRLGFGLIVTVQGFETARYMSRDYDAATRIRAMKWAQWLSAAIYMVYILLLAYVFPPGEMKLTETAIIEMMRVVAPILPVMLVAAALAAQFSAAVADTGGAGGLAAELSHNRLRPALAYIILVGLGIALTWTTDLFAIISYASRAFAAYYALQSGLAALRATGGRRLRYCGLAALGAAIAIFGISAEG
ncbi:amino acid permease [Thioclava sp. 'Guangxiensis']|uniref:amino acid permease n=1 Tax=Thioclava sp. 'Guangxiensis' TaxID=3149044 RepID=UPI003877BFD0